MKPPTMLQAIEAVSQIKNPSYTSTLQESEDFAAANGLKIVYPTKYEVQVDIDAKELPAQFNEILSTLDKTHNVRQVKIERSRSGNLHATVTFKRVIFDEERLLFEAILGGDPKRVAINFMKNEKNLPGKSFLFRPLVDNNVVDIIKWGGQK